MERSEQLEGNEELLENALEPNPSNALCSATQDIEIENEKNFSCLQCAVSFMDLSEFTSHRESKEHNFMMLACVFDEEDAANDKDSLPSLYCCLLCNLRCFDYDIYISHLKGKCHIKMANHMKILLFGDVIDDICSCASKMLSDPYPPLHYCELCDSWYDNCKSFNRHSQSANHNRMKNILFKMCNTNMMDILQNLSTEKISVNDSDSFSQTDYCRLCDVQFNSHKSYEKHIQQKLHKKIEHLMTKMFETKKEKDITMCLKSMTAENFEKSLHKLKYCEYCRIWLRNPKQYNNHLIKRFHIRVKSLHLLMCQIESSFSPQSSEVMGEAHLLSYHCKSCNIAFNVCDYFEKHLKSSIHMRTEQFLKEIRKAKETIIASESFDAPSSDSGYNFISLVHYCELCNIWNSTNSNHSNCRIHKKLETYISKINDKQPPGINNQPFYCELCDIQSTNSKAYYQHLQGRFHIKVNSLVNRIFNKTEQN